MKNLVILASMSLVSLAVCAGGDGVNLANRTRLDAGIYKCAYTYKVKTTDLNGNETVAASSAILHIGENGAKFADVSIFKPDSMAYAGCSSDSIARVMDMLYVQGYPFTSTVYQNYPEGKITTIDLGTSNSLVLTEDFGAFDWELTEDTLTVCDHVCYKAVTKYGGRTWEAWYAEDIPMSCGPWKLSGLPGLIMAAYDTEGVNSFIISSLQHTDVMVSRPKNVKEISVNRKDFLRMRKEYENMHYSFDGPMGEIINQSIASGQSFSVIYNGMPVLFRCANYVPLELE
jgi:GLPGLI family protein